MLIEAIGQPFIYRWPAGEIRLEPGAPMDLPQERAARLMAKAPGRVRYVMAKDMEEAVLPHVHAGDLITWELPDLGRQEGVVNFLSPDSDGSQWAYVTMPDGRWAAVNLKFVAVMER